MNVADKVFVIGDNVVHLHCQLAKLHYIDASPDKFSRVMKIKTASEFNNRRCTTSRVLSMLISILTFRILFPNLYILLLALFHFACVFNAFVIFSRSKSRQLVFVMFWMNVHIWNWWVILSNNFEWYIKLGKKIVHVSQMQIANASLICSHVFPHFICYKY